MSVFGWAVCYLVGALVCFLVAMLTGYTALGALGAACLFAGFREWLEYLELPEDERRGR